MNSALILANGDMRCVLRPDFGGTIASLRFCNVPVLRDVEKPLTVRDMGCFPLVPFSNRVAKAQLQWNGTDHPLVRMGTQEAHALHGVGWQRAWEVLDASDDFAMISLEHPADSAWPFAFDVSQTFKLSSNALAVTMSITNQHSSDAPVGLGWHPYFAKRAGSHIRFESAARWEMSEDKLPTKAKPFSGMDLDCEHLDSDHCFEGWTGVVHLLDEKLHTRIESNLSRLIVFTNETKDFVAIEPVSHASNAVNQSNPQSLGIQVLKSGETFTAQMTIQVSTV
jgi:aldose 1-epimerase